MSFKKESACKTWKKFSNMTKRFFHTGPYRCVSLKCHGNTILDRKQTIPDFSNFTETDFTNVTAYALYIIQWKAMQIAIVPSLKNKKKNKTWWLLSNMSPFSILKEGFTIYILITPSPQLSSNRLTQTGPGCVVPTGKKREEKKKSLLPFN